MRRRRRGDVAVAAIVVSLKMDGLPDWEEQR